MELINEQEKLVLDKEDPLFEIKKAYADKLALLDINEANELAKIDASVPKPTEPLKPKKATKSDHVFALDFNDLTQAIDDRFLSDSEKSEAKRAEKDLANLYLEYQQMLWQISPKSNISPTRFANQYNEVDGISIKKVNSRDYEFTLINGDAATKVIVNPVLTGQDYDKALATFNQEFEQYSQRITAREAELKDKKDAVRSRIAEERKLEEADYQKRLALFKKMEKITKQLI